VIREDEMAQKKKTYHAAMVVTRAEEWCIEASSAEEARTLLAAGEGHRCHPGECLHAEVEQILDEAA
jgi:aspartate carbamoyltransferase catalytic subunit